MNRKSEPHLLCIDLESWIFSKRINKQNLSNAELRRLDNKYKLQALDYALKSLKNHNQRVTFFVVFKLEELYPGIIEKILSQGHEVGWHGHSHTTLKTPEVLIKELELSKTLLKRYHIKGFQAPTISFIREGYSILKKYGFMYSSSIYGNSQNTYNLDGIWEIPVSVSNKDRKPKAKDIEYPSDMRFWKVLKYGIPFGSSFFWSILGRKYYSNKLKEATAQGEICNLFIHDWQLVTPPSKEYKRDVSILSNPLFFSFFFFYRKNVSHTFEYLLSNFSFQTFNSFLKNKGGIK